TLLKAGVYRPGNDWKAVLLKLFCATVVMFVVLQGLLHYWVGWDQWGVFERGVHLLAICLLGVFAYFLSLFLLGFRVKQFARHT
ncbi:MAG: lipid II flippase MurJ, partial [Pseudomonadales bacterium]|nr:lipid II flippase MurJ [Pseudomonadales bacterium]